MKPKTTKPPTTKSIATALEVTARRVGQLRQDGMPVHSIEAALAWRAEKSDGHKVAGDDAAILRAERIGLVRAQRIRTENENARESHLVVSRQECREEWTRIGAAISAMLTAVESEIPRVVSGLPLAQALPKAKDKMREIRAKFADEESEYWSRHKLTTNGSTP